MCSPQSRPGATARPTRPSPHDERDHVIPESCLVGSLNPEVAPFRHRRARHTGPQPGPYGRRARGLPVDPRPQPTRDSILAQRLPSMLIVDPAAAAPHCAQHLLCTPEITGQELTCRFFRRSSCATAIVPTERLTCTDGIVGTHRPFRPSALRLKLLGVVPAELVLRRSTRRRPRPCGRRGRSRLQGKPPAGT